MAGRGADYYALPDEERMRRWSVFCARLDDAIRATRQADGFDSRREPYRTLGNDYVTEEQAARLSWSAWRNSR